MEVESTQEPTVGSTVDPISEKGTKESIEEQKAKEAEKLEKANKCADEIKSVLAKWNCDFDVSVLLRHNGVFPNIQIVVKD